MNWLDLVILGSLAGGFLWSFRQGFIMEVIYFVAAFGGLLGAFLLYPFLRPLIQVSVEGTQAASTVSFFALFVLIAGLIGIFGMLLHKFIYMINLGIFDRFLGGLFGLVKVAMIASVVLVMFVGTKGEDTPEYVENSVVCRPILNVTTGVVKSVPPLFATFHEDYGKPAVKWMKEKREEMRDETG